MLSSQVVNQIIHLDLKYSNSKKLIDNTYEVNHEVICKNYKNFP